MLYSDIAAAAAPIRQRLDQARHVLVLTHLNPDGDAIGSLAAFAGLLRREGRQVTAVAPTPLPASASAIHERDQIHVYTQERKLPEEADLIVILDTGSLSRLGPIFNEQLPYLNQRTIIVIDHHITNEGAGEIDLVVPESAATCELLADLFACWNVELDSTIATALMLGLLSDTQNFRTSATTPHSLAVAAQLLERGAELEQLTDALYRTSTSNNLQAMGLSLSRLEREGALIWADLTQSTMHATGADDEAADEVIAQLVAINDGKIFALFKERADKTVKLSLRSRPGINVSTVAAQLGGGGHAQACGATLMMPIDRAKETVLPLLRELLATP